MPKEKTPATAQKILTVYLIINGLFLLPMNLFYFSKEIMQFCTKYLGVIVFLGIYYIVLLLPVVHLVLNAGFLVYLLAIILKKDKNWGWFAASFFAVVFSTWSNAFLLYTMNKPNVW